MVKECPIVASGQNERGSLQLDSCSCPGRGLSDALMLMTNTSTKSAFKIASTVGIFGAHLTVGSVE